MTIFVLSYFAGIRLKSCSFRYHQTKKQFMLRRLGLLCAIYQDQTEVDRYNK
jgi:hypothetical protein